MLNDLQEANPAWIAIDNAQVPLVVADSENLRKRAPVILDALSRIELLCTETQPSRNTRNTRNMLTENEIDLVIRE